MITYVCECYLAVYVGHFSSKNHAANFSLHLHTLERCPLWLGELHGLRNNPLLLQVHLMAQTSEEVINKIQVWGLFTRSHMRHRFLSTLFASALEHLNVCVPPRRCFPAQGGRRSCVDCRKDAWWCHPEGDARRWRRSAAAAASSPGRGTLEGGGRRSSPQQSGELTTRNMFTSKTFALVLRWSWFHRRAAWCVFADRDPWRSSRWCPGSPRVPPCPRGFPAWAVPAPVRLRSSPRCPRKERGDEGPPHMWPGCPSASLLWWSRS